MLRLNHPLLKIVNGVIVDLPTPANITVMWNWGSLLGLTLVVQLLSGILLALRFSAVSFYSFESVVIIFQDSSYGWLLRLIHSTGASFFFLFLYLHIGRGLYYGSFVNGEVWVLGMLIYLILIGTAFLGYVLPWGQISFWAATVITNLVSAIPYVGSDLVQWVWGGFAVGHPTLVRFFALHYLLPFIVTFLVVLHIFFLHSEGSSNPVGLSSTTYNVSFHHSFTVNDSLFFIFFIFILALFSLSLGYSFMDAENFIEANPLVTPVHIQPEWYFLFAYAILRSIPNNLGGVIGLLISILLFFLFPLLKPAFAGISFSSPAYRFLFWSLVSCFFVLTWLGIMPAEPPFVSVAAFATVAYFTLVTSMQFIVLVGL